MRSLAYFIGDLRGRSHARHRLGLVHDRARLPADDHQSRPLGGLDQRGQPECRPYTEAHVARSGRLPLSSTVARYFVGPDRQRRAHPDLRLPLFIIGSPLNARWWSLAVYDEYGGLIANPSGRYSFNNEELLRHADGSFRINLSSNARPENWLPTGAVEQPLVLMLRIYSPRETDASGIGLIPGDRLPKIERTVCE